MLMKIVNTGSKKGNCYALCSKNEILLLDCGCDKKSILRAIDYNISKVAGCLLSHIHGDHSKSHKWLLENRIPIYTNNETVESIENTLCIGMPEKKWFKCGSFQIMPLYVPHDDCPNYAFLIYHKDFGKLLYATDLEYFKYKLTDFKINHLLLEANYINEFINSNAHNFTHQIKGHCSLDTCKGIIEANKTADLKTVTLIHLSDKVCDPNRVLKEVKEIVPDIVDVNIAHPALEIELKNATNQ